jgi:flagellar hook-associated protein 2
MAVRMTGLVSNMDTDSIIKELMNVQNMKKTKVENKITKVEWKHYILAPLIK